MTLGSDGAVAVDDTPDGNKVVQDFKEYIFRTNRSRRAGDAFLAGLVVSQAWGANCLRLHILATYVQGFL